MINVYILNLAWIILTQMKFPFTCTCVCAQMYMFLTYLNLLNYFVFFSLQKVTACLINLKVSCNNTKVFNSSAPSYLDINYQII